MTDGVLVAELSGVAADRPGFLQIWDASAEPGGTLLVFRDSFRGKIELGEIAIGSSAPILVSGRVVGPDGKAAYGAKVSVMCRLPSGNARGFADHSATTDALGAFAIRGEVRGEGIAFELRAEGRWQTENAVRFSAGAKDVKLVAQQTSGVHGSVVVPGGLSLSDLVVVMKGPAHGTDSVRFDDGGFISCGGTNDRLEFPARAFFGVVGLLPGTYDVRLKFAGSSRYLARIPEAVVDDTSSDLPPLKVTDTIGHVKAHVVLPAGVAAEGTTLWARNGGDRGKFRKVALDAKTAADVAFAGDDVTLWACGAGTDWVSATTAGPEVSLTIPAAAPVAVGIDLPDGAKRADPQFELLVALQWYGDASLAKAQVEALRDDADPRAGIEIELPLLATGPATGKALVAGWYRVAFTAKQPNFKTSRPLGLICVVPGEPVSAPLGMSAADIADFLSRIGRR
jgi:hypothetical protein